MLFIEKMSDIAEKEASEVLRSFLSVEQIQDKPTATLKNSSQHWHTPEFGLLSNTNRDLQNNDKDNEDMDDDDVGFLFFLFGRC